MISEPLLPAEVRALFRTGQADRRTLSVPLPPGRNLASDEGVGDTLALWLSDGPASAELWTRLLAEHPRSGLWPLLLDALDPQDAAFRPWVSGELYPEDMSSPDIHDPAAILAGWWMDNTTVEESLALPEPFGQYGPGVAPKKDRQADADRLAAGYAQTLTSRHPHLRLGLVAAGSGADALTVSGWDGPSNYDSDTAKYSAVVRDWEWRFGARVVAVGFNTLSLSVAVPPANPDDALHIAAEHFAFCPDNVWPPPGRGAHPHTLASYAERLIDTYCWEFYWD